MSRKLYAVLWMLVVAFFLLGCFAPKPQILAVLLGFMSGIILTLVAMGTQFVGANRS